MLSQKPKYIPTYLEHIPGINRNGPFVADVMCVLPHLRLDITGNYTFTNSGSTPIKTGLGPGMNVAASEYIQTVENFSAPLSGSLIIYFNPARSGIERIVGYDNNWEIGHVSNQFFCDLYGSNSTRVSSEAGWNILVCSWSSDGSNRHLRNWVNGNVGVDVTESASAVSANNFSLGTRTGQTTGLNGDMLLFAMSSRELSDIEGRRLSTDPWPIFQPSRIRGSRILPFGFGTSAGGATNIQPTAGSISIAGQTASAVTNALPSPGEGSLSIAGQSVTITVSVAVAPDAGSLSVSGSTMSAFTSSLPSPDSASLSISGQDVTVTPGSVLEPTAGSLSIAGQSAALGFTLLPASGSISITGLTATVTVSGAVELNPESATLAIAGQTASAITNSLVSPANGTLSISGSDLTIDQNVDVIPGVATLLINGNTVTVDAVFAVDSSKGVVTVVVEDIVSDVIFDTVN